jgi:hypothetical protein
MRIFDKNQFVIKAHYKNIYGNELGRPSDYVTNQIKFLTEDILSYLEINPVSVVVDILYLSEKRYSNHSNVGQYGNNFITIKVLSDYTYEDVAAIAVHECMHHFMELNGLNVDDTQTNEANTDIYCVLLGFADIMIAGYKRHWSGPSDKDSSSRIGYIPPEDCQSAKMFAEDKKKERRVEKERINTRDLIRSQATDKVNIVIRSYEQLLSLAKNHINELSNIQDNSVISSIQEVFTEIEQGNIREALTRLKNTANNLQNETEAGPLHNEINALYVKIYNWSQMIQKNI